MARFTVRVLLHNGGPTQYHRLNDEMRDGLGAFRAIRGDNGIVYDLPEGEYDVVREASVTQVLQLTMAIAMRVRALPLPLVMVSECRERAWALRPVPRRSESWIEFDAAERDGA